jgi:pimeloyl-ACP methyl ester carboxylesterase
MDQEPPRDDSLLFATGFSRWFRNERARQDELCAQGRIANTARGEIEYAKIGRGPVVLGIHGDPGGFDQSLYLFEHITGAGFSLLAPSRPGYLGTPLSTGKTPAEQADAFAALLDVLGIYQVSLLFGSTGGPSGYQFAIRHPDRVRALVAIDAVATQYLLPCRTGAIEQRLFLSGPGEQLISFIARAFPATALRGFLRQESVLTGDQIDWQVKAARGDPAQIRAFLRLVRSMSDFKRRRAGVANDLAQLASLTDLPLEKIACPALIVHGTHDGDVLFYHGVLAAEKISRAERCWVREGSHLCAWISPQAAGVQDYILAFLKYH